MLVTLLGIVTDVKPLQPQKAPPAMDSMPSGIVNAPEYEVGRHANICALYTGEVKPLQPLKANSPMLVTLFGIVIEVKPVHSSKACPPMLMTLLPIVTEVKPLQSKKALLPMLVTLYDTEL